MKNKHLDQSRIPEEVQTEYRKLEREHHRLEVELNELVRHKTLTPQEESEKKRIQVEKLHTKDRMEAILRSEKHDVEINR